MLIDENGRGFGKVALHFWPEAEKAAMQARFSPTVINDKPVKVLE